MLRYTGSRFFLNIKNQVPGKTFIEFVPIRSFHLTTPLNKKSGEFISSLQDENTDNKSKKNVKLYPGFQTSHEERTSYAVLNQDKLSAKKAIEDFYGLNKFEYDDQDQEHDANEDNTKSFGGIKVIVIQLFLVNFDIQRLL
jgi:hypothetical protein